MKYKRYNDTNISVNSQKEHIGRKEIQISVSEMANCEAPIVEIQIC